MKLMLLKWVAWWSALGFAVPILLILGWRLFGLGFGQSEAILWPSSIMLMGLEGPTQRSALDIVEIYALSIVENVLLYSFVGLLASLVFHFGRRRHNPST